MNHPGNTIRMLPWLWAPYVLLMFAPPFLIRITLITQQGLTPGLLDGRGFVSDLFFSAILALVFRALAPLHLAPALLLPIVWALLNYRNYEHIRVLGASADWSSGFYLFDPTFVKGSALSVSSPVLLGCLMVVTVALLATICKRRAYPPQMQLLMAIIGSGILTALIPEQSDALDWRQANFVHSNIAAFRYRSFSVAKNKQLPQPEEAPLEFYSQDLQGKSRVAPPQREVNVLLLMIEGISGMHLPSVAKAHGHDSTIKLHRLDRIAKSNLSFSTFIAHNRQTNRGEYAILCGALPELDNREPRMTQIAAGRAASCLPKVLHEAGYHTEYLQAAPMAFMAKDAFMPAAGFEESHGEEWFDNPYLQNQWGVDDQSFLQQSLKKIAQLQTSEGPWFLSLLTVGTHHPYLIPKSEGKPSFPAAARRLEEAISDFIRSLEELGVLDDTLVIITSDESVGITGYRGWGRFTDTRKLDDLGEKLADNWGVLIALTPSRDNQSIDQAFAQSDIALSVLDYLGLAHKAQGFIGRSVFRSYQNGRRIPFGNVYKKYLGVAEADRSISLCSIDLRKECQRFLGSPGMFSTERTYLDTDPASLELLRQLVNDEATSTPAGKTWPLVAKTPVLLLDKPDMQVLFGGQYLSTQPGQILSVDLKLTLKGGPGQMRPGLRLHANGKRLYSRGLPTLNSGDTLVFGLDYHSKEALKEIEAIGTAIVVEGIGLELEFELANLAISTPQTLAVEDGGEVKVRVLEVRGTDFER